MSPTAARVSFLSAIVISVGSTIGAGIFFKNDNIFANAQGQLGFIIAAWIVAAVGILAIGVALIEVASASNRDGGIVDWVKRFAPRWLGKYSASYMIFIYIPLTYVALPIYAVQALQDATDNKWISSGWVIVAIAFAFFLWFAVIAFLRFKVAERLQWIFTGLKFLPLIVIPILGVVEKAQVGGAVETYIAGATSVGLTGFSPWLGLLASIPSILFAFDGFYTVVSLRSRLHNPRTIGPITAIAIAIVTAAYLFYSLLTALVGKRQPNSIGFIQDNPWLAGLVHSIIALAVLGIVNGYALSSPSVYQTIGEEDAELSLHKWMRKLFRIKANLTLAWLNSVLISIIFYTVLVPISLYAWQAQSDLLIASYGASTASLYEMADLLTNFTSLLIFIFIGIALAGAMVNRRRSKVVVVQQRFFLLAAGVSVIFIGSAALYMFVAELTNMFGVNGANQLTAIVRFSILLGTTMLAALPLVIARARRKWSTRAPSARAR